MDQRFRCEICKVRQLSGFPKVCLELDDFLKKQFPEEYALRRESVELREGHQHDSPSTCMSFYTLHVFDDLISCNLSLFIS